jgi:quinol monooxygenase YgiN
MPKLVELDDRVTLRDQMGQSAAPVVLVNLFTAHPDEADRFVEAWTVDAEVMKRQPGYVSAQLHRGLGGSGRFLNYAVWESVDHFRSAFANPEFQAHMNDYPPSTVASPHLFERLAVPGIG